VERNQTLTVFGFDALTIGIIGQPDALHAIELDEITDEYLRHLRDPSSRIQPDEGTPPDVDASCPFQILWLVDLFQGFQG
jgi:hypothetical protein